MNLKSMIRWTTVAGCGGFGIYGLYQAIKLGAHAMTQPQHLGFAVVFVPLFTFLAGAVPLMIAWFSYRREYHSVLAILSALGTIAVFCAVLDGGHVLQREMMSRFGPTHPVMEMFGIPLSLIGLLAPFCVAAWFSRITLRSIGHVGYKPKVYPPVGEGM